VFWGGTYLATKLAVETIPPFLLGGLRFFTAGALVFLWEWRKGNAWPEMNEWLGAGKVGGLLLVVSMGGLNWAQQFIPSGIAAIIFATVPLWMVLFGWYRSCKARPQGRSFTGLLLGFCGIVFLVSRSMAEFGNNPLAVLGFGMATLASAAWAWGSLSSRYAPQPDSPLMAAAMQNLIGGACYFLISFCVGEWGAFSAGQMSPASFLSLIYLIVFGSLVGFGAYIWLLKVADPTLVSTYAYINPIVAVVLGCTVAGELLTTSDMMAAAVVVFAVVLIVKQPSRP
jgi:drug/metabolite transporter (DMT)-like permease